MANSDQKRILSLHKSAEPLKLLLKTVWELLVSFKNWDNSENVRKHTSSNFFYFTF